jgi:hypothetical protein
MTNNLTKILLAFMALLHTATAQYQGWQHSGSFFLLTTPEGANLPATASLEGFPLLLRLDKDCFDFKQAQGAGEDLRFAAGGKPLVYQIDNWDATAATAAIWVRIPVIMEIYQSATEGPATEIPVNSKASSIPITRSTPTPASGVTVEKTDPAAKSAGKKSLALELAERRQKEPTLVALAVLPGGACRRATVLLAAAADNTFTAYVINDDPTKLPVGQVRIHNLCPFPIAMRCNGGKVHEIKFKDAILVPAKKDHLVYELAYLDGEKWRMQENNVIPVHPQEQSQMLILKSDNSFFLGNDGSRSGFLQIVTLCRSPDAR